RSAPDHSRFPARFHLPVAQPARPSAPADAPGVPDGTTGIAVWLRPISMGTMVISGSGLDLSAGGSIVREAEDDIALRDPAGFLAFLAGEPRGGGAGGFPGRAGPGFRS